ncbi:MAG TPA: fused MFS/spermidine synthase [Saprospiraceae bacterium]|nr:fused MFS/spermidine synthase [Saprospiraceae bacterium]
MKIPFWKKWLSYLQPQVLEMTGSEQNPELTVLLYRGRLQLLSGNAVYSWDDLYRNFNRAFARLDLEQRPYEDVLLLGLGLGSVPFILEKVYGRHYRYTAVEWDETVAELATRYTFSRLDSPVEIVVADAAIFTEVNEDQYDMLIVDIFEDDLTPPQFLTREFLECCDERLRHGGVLLFNCLYNRSHERSATKRFFEHTFKAVFPGAEAFDTDGNWVLCYTKPD